VEEISMIRWTVRGGIVLGLLAVSLAAGGVATAAPATQQAIVVEMASNPNRFGPTEVVVAPGTTVTWRTVSGSHSTTSETGLWDSVDRLPVGQSYSFTFNDVGEYAYFCRAHQDQAMAGKVIVRS
jgi:plastocyanin